MVIHVQELVFVVLRGELLQRRTGARTVWSTVVAEILGEHRPGHKRGLRGGGQENPESAKRQQGPCEYGARIVIHGERLLLAGGLPLSERKGGNAPKRRGMEPELSSSLTCPQALYHFQDDDPASPSGIGWTVLQSRSQRTQYDDTWSGRTSAL